MGYSRSTSYGNCKSKSKLSLLVFIGIMIALALVISASYSPNDSDADDEGPVTCYENGLRYELSQEGTTAKVVHDVYSGNITILAEITYGDVDYTVTEIGEQAFKDCDEITSVRIPATITLIGKDAFLGCDSLERIIFETVACTVSTDAFPEYQFFECDGKTQITDYSDLPGHSFTSVGKMKLVMDPNITFDTNGGSTEMPGMFVQTGGELTLPGYEGALIGHSFGGWTSEGITYAAGDKLTKTADSIIFTAVWNINQYTITFDTVDGSYVSAITQDYNTDVSKPADPSKMGNEFKGWILNGQPYTFGKMPAEDITLTAIWSVNKYTITFDTDGGSDVPSITQEYGSVVVKPADPSKLGHIFVHWIDEDGKAYDFDTMPAKDMTLTAVWSVKKYTITFDTGDGSDVPQIIDYYMTDISAPEPPVKKGHSFVKWQKDGVDYSFTKMPAEDITLTAVWSINQYTITFDSVNGTPVNSITGNYGTIIEAPANPTRLGYEFIKWQENGKDFIFVSIPDRNLTLTAVWSINQYTITFDSNGGSPVEAIKKDYNTPVSAPVHPTRTEATFVKWQLNGNDYEFTVMPAENITLRAVWTVNQYTVTYNTDGGSEIPPQNIEYGAQIAQPSDPTKEGYSFVKWMKGEDDYEFGTMPAEDMTLTAVWKINQYTITFDTCGGSTVASITADFDSAISAPEAPVRKGCEFLKWQDNGVDFTISKMPSRDVTLKAVWDYLSFTITFDPNGGSEVAPITEKYESKIHAPTEPTLTGYRLVEWQKDGVRYEFDTMPNEDITLKAKWTLKEVTIHFDTDGGTEIDDITKTYGSPISAPLNPKKDGHTFLKWQLNGEDFVFDQKSTMPADDITLTAIWTVNEYTLSFDKDNGDEIESVKYLFGTPITKPKDPVKTGYSFVGWYQSGEEFQFATMPADDITVIAVWKINQYTISFDSNGGSSVEDIKRNYNSAVSEPQPPIREGHRFIEWDDSDGKKYEFSKMPAENIVLTAVWQVNRYTITFDSDGGTEIGGITDFYGTEITAPAAPIKEGYDFAGWSWRGVPYTFSTIPADDIELKAMWDAKECTITFDPNGGTISVVAITGHYGDPVEAPIPEKEGCKFEEWQIDGEYYDVSSIPAENVTVKAKWTVNEYIISFDSNGGTQVEYIKQKYGTKIHAPAQPTKVENKFISWQLNGKDFEFDTMPAANITLMANWKVNQYTITFDSNGGSPVEDMTQDYNSEITEPKPVREGYVFKWWADKDGPYIFTYMPSGGKELKAVWERAPRTVTFKIDQDTEFMKETIGYDLTVDEPLVEPTLIGNTFKYWQLNDEKYDFTSPVKDDITLIAKWTPNPYRITFDTDGGSQIADVIYDYGTDISPPKTPIKEGNSFQMWIDENEDEFVFTTMPARDVDLKAKWLPKPYEIIFDSNGGTEVDKSTEYYGTGIYPPISPTKEGYRFVNWQENGEDFEFTTMPARNVRLLAVWAIDQFEVTFIDDSSHTISRITQDYMSTVTAPTIEKKEGHRLEWRLEDPEGAVYDFKVPAKDVKVYAVWIKMPFTISFDSDGGSDVEDITKMYNEEVSEPEAPTKEGHTFAGWQLDGKDYVFSVMPGKDITLKAVWTVNEFTMTFVFGEGDQVKVKQKYGTVVEIPDIPDKEGHSFKGWNCNGEPYTVTVMPAAHVTVNAVWAVNQYTISFDTDGGSEVKPITQDYDTGVHQPDMPSKKGYSFVKWVDEFQDEYKFTKMPSRNIKLTAVWNINTYMVTFDTDGGTYVPYQTVKYGDTIEVPDEPTKTKYEFLKWQKDGKDYEFGTMPAENITIKAVWGRVYTATFINNGKTFHEDVLHNGDQIAYPGDPEKASTETYDFRFIKWSGYVDGMQIYSDISFEAQYQKVLKKVDTGGETIKVEVIDADNVVIGSDCIDNIVSSSSDGKDVRITLSNGSITLDSASASSLPAGEKTIRIASADKSKIKEDIRAQIQDRPVYSINIGDVHEFAGTLTISLKYTPATGEDTDDLYIWYIRDDGTCEKIECTYFDGFVTFTTGHLSDYAVMLETEEPEPEPTPDPKPKSNPYGGNEMSIGLVVGIAVAIIAVVAVALFVVKKKH